MDKADNIHRFIAKTIDFLIVGILSKLFIPFGILAAILYIIISDGFFNGQSLGKRLVGIRVIVTRPEEYGRACGFRDSWIRNLPYGAILFLSMIPILGYLVLLLGILFVLAEAYFVFADERGIRIGDIYADTQVVDVDVPRRP